MQLVLGIDCGSVAAKGVLLRGGAVAHAAYVRHRGRPREGVVQLLGEMAAHAGGQPVRICCTGVHGAVLANALDCTAVGELAAHARGAVHLVPGAEAVFEMGGEDSKLLLLESPGSPVLRDFALNAVCAAGTGSFLDQQAERMGLTIEEFGALALTSSTPARVAGRCSVFAKSDMIHLQQVATPLADIAAGLCLAVARNYQGAIVRGRDVGSRVVFTGGVAANAGVVRALRQVFDGVTIEVPELAPYAGALGAALATHEATATHLDDALLQRVQRAPTTSTHADTRTPLRGPDDAFDARHLQRDCDGRDGCQPPLPTASYSPPRLFLGVDIGSISTNLVLIDEAGRLLAKRYLRTASKPIEAVRTGLGELEAELSALYPGHEPGALIAGVGTTGSGRYMTCDFIGADVVKNEITAQATAAVFIDPEVDTIFEIGGQDSKYISLANGVITDFEMNRACAAGTGSFLEEQAERLGVDVKGEFAPLALGAEAPCRLGERCTVFMETSVAGAVSAGRPTGDILAGLAYSIVENYINRVVSTRPIGQRIFFQGGTAFNKAVVAAFERFTGARITVPPNHDVTGAIGMALIARDAVASGQSSRFKGFGRATVDYSLDSFVCTACDNRCEINRVTFGDGAEGDLVKDDERLLYGGRCEKYEQARKGVAKSDKPDLPDLFAERQALLEAAHHAHANLPAPRGVIGLPRVFFAHDYLPFFATLLARLGFAVCLTPMTTPAIAARGVRATLADTCYPVKVAMGHVRTLLEEGVTTLFIPSVVDGAWQPLAGGSRSGYPSAQTCPLTQSFPYQVRVSEPGARVIAPALRLGEGWRGVTKALTEALAPLGVTRAEVLRAIAPARRAQDDFFAALRARGHEVLDMLEREGRRGVVVLGRAYNAFDPGMNLQVPEKLARLGERGELAIPADMLAEADVSDAWPQMYWRSGQRILGAARTVRNHPLLQPLFIGNFSCGPDSFILKYMDAELAAKPALCLEIDEHAADAGVVTRCEAFLDRLDMHTGGQPPKEQRRTGHATRPSLSGPRTGLRAIWLPPMADHARLMAAAFRACGMEARVLPPSDGTSMELGRAATSGKECYPCAVTTGDMLRKCAEPDFDPARNGFFMPGGAGPCRFGQYAVFQRMALDAAGYGDVGLFSPMQSAALYREANALGRGFDLKLWRAIVACDLLTKALHETRPYERDPGSTDRVYAEALARMEAALEANADLVPALRGAREAFAGVACTDAARPRIGVVGEIFVRGNRFANEELIRRIEALGGEAVLAPMDEWIYYVNLMGQYEQARKGHHLRRLGLRAKEAVQRREGTQLESVFAGLLHTLHEPTTREVLAKAAPWLHSSFQGEAILSVGKAVDMAERGVAGIVNAMPFGCMPGTVGQTILTDVSRTHGVPSITLAFDGTPSPATALTLTSFMERVAERRQVAKR